MVEYNLGTFVIECLHPLQEELHTFETMMSQMIIIAIMKTAESPQSNLHIQTNV